MRWSLLIETGWCGVGFAGGMIPEVRLGFLRVAVCRGWLLDHVRRYRTALTAASHALGLPDGALLP